MPSWPSRSMILSIPISYQQAPLDITGLTIHHIHVLPDSPPITRPRHISAGLATCPQTPQPITRTHHKSPGPIICHQTPPLSQGLNTYHQDPPLSSAPPLSSGPTTIIRTYHYHQPHHSHQDPPLSSGPTTITRTYHYHQPHHYHQDPPLSSGPTTIISPITIIRTYHYHQSHHYHQDLPLSSGPTRITRTLPLSPGRTTYHQSPPSITSPHHLSPGPTTYHQSQAPITRTYHLISGPTTIIMTLHRPSVSCTRLSTIHQASPSITRTHLIACPQDLPPIFTMDHQAPPPPPTSLSTYNTFLLHLSPALVACLQSSLFVISTHHPSLGLTTLWPHQAQHPSRPATSYHKAPSPIPSPTIDLPFPQAPLRSLCLYRLCTRQLSRETIVTR